MWEQNLDFISSSQWYGETVYTEPQEGEQDTSQVIKTATAKRQQNREQVYRKWILNFH